MKKNIELEIHDDYFKALEELLSKSNVKYGVTTIDQLVSIIVRKHVLDDLEELNS